VHNLRANPAAHVEVGAESYDITARELQRDERDALFDRLVELAPVFGDYQAQISRLIPLFELQADVARLQGQSPKHTSNTVAAFRIEARHRLNLEVKRDRCPRHTRRRPGILVPAVATSVPALAEPAYPTARLTPSPRS